MTIEISKSSLSQIFFFFNDTATTEIYTLSLHDALPICASQQGDPDQTDCEQRPPLPGGERSGNDDHRAGRSEEHTSELQSQSNLVCRLLLEKKNVSVTHD